MERAIDGDTLVMENAERVRLIGVDTPETKHPDKPVERFGKEAAAFTRAVRAHKDRTQQRRTLAYVFLEDGTLLNAEIIKQGYDFAYTRFPFARIEEFRRLEGRRGSNGGGCGCRTKPAPPQEWPVSAKKRRGQVLVNSSKRQA